jgi:hypothetical protein
VLWTISRGCLWPLLLIITFLMLLDQRPATSAASEPIWQLSQAPVAKLGVRDKYGSLGGYTAVWIVSAPDGAQYQAKKTVVGDDNGYVFFPDDFPTYSKVGRYSWKYFVNGHEVVHGSFEFGQYGLQLTVISPF